MEEKKDIGITVKKNENFSEWYLQVLIKSEFIDYSEVSGCIIFKPLSYGAWQQIVEATDKEFKKDGIEDTYFPLLIPEKLLQKEQAHLEGFVPEVAWVTQTGDKKLEEKLAIRPTSETIMYSSYSKWIRSWRDLPLRYNQWNNVLRWEFKHPTPFIRSREFLWNEGHSAFANEKEAIAERDRILAIYVKILREYLALPGIVGKKTDTEKFAGAVESFSIEHVMPDGWALQGPDHHFDGQNFSKAFDIKFLNTEGKWEYVWQTTYAISTREFGVMVATHGDDKGLVVPPKIAHIQIVIVPIYKSEDQETVMKQARKIYNLIKDIFRVKIDEREGYSPGFKFNDWELKGIPLRIEIGIKDIKSDSVMFARRDTGDKKSVKMKDIEESITLLFDEMQKDLYKKAEEFLRSHTHIVSTVEEFKKVLNEKGGILSAPWCGDSKCELKMKDDYGTKITNIPIQQPKHAAKCICCGKKAKFAANFARSY